MKWSTDMELELQLVNFLMLELNNEMSPIVAVYFYL